MVNYEKCKQDTCTVYKDGKCLEGLEKEECPHFYVDDIVDIDEPINVPKENLSIRLFSGEELGLKDTKLLTYRYDSKVVLIIGDSNSGKTTLLVTLFDLFQKGTINDLLFAGSLTQIGFEKRCHFSRVSSDMDVPETEKTKTDEFNFLHLAVKNKTNLDKEATHLLLSDISGERFQLAASSSIVMKELNLLKTADCLLMLIDGQKLFNGKTRQVTIESVKSFIQKALHEGMFDSNSQLRIVISKWDLLESDSNINYIDFIETKLSSLRTKINIQILKMAARPLSQTDEIPFGWGIDNILEDWVSDKPNTEIKVPAINKSLMTRFFDTYKFEPNL